MGQNETDVCDKTTFDGSNVIKINVEILQKCKISSFIFCLFLQGILVHTLFHMLICVIIKLTKSLALWERWRQSRRRGKECTKRTLSPAIAGALPKGEPLDMHVYFRYLCAYIAHSCYKSEI